MTIIEVELSDELVEVIADMGLTPEDWLELQVRDLEKRYQVKAEQQVIADNADTINSNVAKAKDRKKPKAK